MTERPPLLAEPVNELSGKIIDVMVWGGSRPELLRRCIKSFREHLRFSGTLRWLYQDCDYHHTRALECLQIVENAGFTESRIRQPVPGELGVMSYGYSMTAAFNDLVRAPLMYSLEEDHEALRPIDLDLAWGLFDQHRHINQLRFNRRKNPGEENDGTIKVLERSLDVSGRPVTISSSKNWYFQPSIWRMSFVRPRWRGHFANVHHGTQRDLLPSKRPPPEYFLDVLGAVTMGGIGEPAFMVHTGTPEHSLHHAMGHV